MAQDVNIFKNLVMEQLASAGRAALSGLFPRDFEYYLVALELTTFDGDTIDFFSFPIMPSSITKTETAKTSIYQTLGGITVINSDAYTPEDLTLTGDFGRAFKLMVGNFGDQFVSFKGVKFSNTQGIYHSDEIDANLAKKIPDFNGIVKSGFGCIKILQSIIDRATGHDNGKPFRLYFYNLALGESYLVVPTKNPLVLSQNENKNIIWNYTLNLTIVAPLDRVDFGAGAAPRTLTNLLTQAAIQNAASAVAESVVKYIAS